MNRPGVADRVLDLAAVGAIGRTRMTDLEMGAQARNTREWDRIAVEADAYPLVPIGPAAFERALAVQRLLAGKSQRGRKLPDLLIAAVAEAAGLIVLHYDADFDRIAAVTGQPCEWVATSPAR